MTAAGWLASISLDIFICTVGANQGISGYSKITMGMISSIFVSENKPTPFQLSLFYKVHDI